MTWAKIHNFGVEDLPEEYICASTDIKPTTDIVTGSLLWEYDTKKAYIFADDNWREI